MSKKTAIFVEPDAGVRPGNVMRRLIETAVVVVVGAVWVRTFLLLGLIVPVNISGGSMAMSLQGWHHLATCARCSRPFACGAEHLPSADRTLCPNCGYRGHTLSAGGLQAGDRVWIDRVSPELRTPCRFEVIAFRCPEQPEELCVKRVLGLPGESIALRRGDIYVGGRLLQKDYSQVKSCSLLVHDARYQAAPATAAWRPASPASQWRSDAGQAGQFQFDPRVTGNSGRSPTGTDWLRYRHWTGRPITDDYAYNQQLTRTTHEVTDLRLTCSLHAQRAATVRLALATGTERLEVVLPATAAGGEKTCDPRALLLRNEAEIARSEAKLGSLSGPVEVDFSCYDRRVILALDGRVVLDHTLGTSEGPPVPVVQPVALGARGGRVRVGDLRLWRDVYYTLPARAVARGEVSTSWRLAADELFVLGDNSPISHDSRTFAAAGLPRKLIRGVVLGTR